MKFFVGDDWLVPQPMKSPPEADSIRHLRPIESATPSEGFEHR
jgi:hypothetical protein